MYKPKEHEELFDINPVGVRYRCEFCNNGEMKVDPKQTIDTKMDKLYVHTCTNCEKQMQLPKVYPYIEWHSAE